MLIEDLKVPSHMTFTLCFVSRGSAKKTHTLIGLQRTNWAKVYIYIYMDILQGSGFRGLTLNDGRLIGKPNWQLRRNQV